MRAKQYLDRRGKKYLELTRVDTLDLKQNVIKKILECNKQKAPPA